MQELPEWTNSVYCWFTKKCNPKVLVNQNTMSELIWSIFPHTLASNFNVVLFFRIIRQHFQAVKF